MVEATPPDWRDTCEHCGESFDVGEPRWLERREYFVHTRCAKWERWDAPPYMWKLKELRRLHGQTTGRQRERVVRAGLAIRAMERAWPIDAAAHVGRVVEACRGI